MIRVLFSSSVELNHRLQTYIARVLPSLIDLFPASSSYVVVFAKLGETPVDCNGFRAHSSRLNYVFGCQFRRIHSPTTYGICKAIYIWCLHTFLLPTKCQPSLFWEERYEICTDQGQEYNDTSHIKIQAPIASISCWVYNNTDRHISQLT